MKKQRKERLSGMKFFGFLSFGAMPCILDDK